MPEPMTRADSLRLYWTGAATDGATQNDPAASRGLHRSSHRVAGMRVQGAPACVVIEHTSAINGVGVGSLCGVGETGLQWTPPGGSAGPVEEIAIGQTRLIEGGGEQGRHQHLLVRRVAVNASSEPVSVGLLESQDEVLSLGDVTATEAATGGDVYRLICLRNESLQLVRDIRLWLEPLGTPVTSMTATLGETGAGTIVTTESLSDWPASGYCQIRRADGSLREIVYFAAHSDSELAVPATGRGLLGTEPTLGSLEDVLVPISGVRIGMAIPDSQPDGSFGELTSLDSPPADVSWCAPMAMSDALNLGVLNPGEIAGIWIHRQIPAAAVASAAMTVRLSRSFESV